MSIHILKAFANYDKDMSSTLEIPGIKLKQYYRFYLYKERGNSYRRLGIKHMFTELVTLMSRDDYNIFYRGIIDLNDAKDMTELELVLKYGREITDQHLMFNSDIIDEWSIP